MNSQHPYPNGSEQIFTITAPIILSSGKISYDEVVIVEPGISGITNHTNPNFFNFCVVEGSTDGITWVALAPGYDSRDDPNWLSTFAAGGAGSPSLFKRREITIPQGLFEQGASVFIRFRLFADAGLAGWGWAVDNLAIQTEATSVDSDGLTPRAFDLARNFPNPFNPTTSIRYSLAEASEVKLTIFNVVGQKVRTLLNNKRQSASDFTVQWNGRDDGGQPVASGMYVYRLEATGGSQKFVQSRR